MRSAAMTDKLKSADEDHNGCRLPYWCSVAFIMALLLYLGVSITRTSHTLASFISTDSDSASPFVASSVRSSAEQTAELTVAHCGVMVAGCVVQ